MTTHPTLLRHRFAKGGSKVGWVELFFDLVFESTTAAAVAAAGRSRFQVTRGSMISLGPRTVYMPVLIDPIGPGRIVKVHGERGES